MFALGYKKQKGSTLDLFYLTILVYSENVSFV